MGGTLNLEIILMHDSPCVSHLVMHALKTFRFEASCLFKYGLLDGAIFEHFPQQKQNSI